MRVLAVTAHPDDETLGAGGTLLTHRDRGDELHWLVVTRAFEPRWSEAHVARQRECVDAMAKRYGVAALHWPGLPSGRLDDVGFESVIDPIAQVVRQVAPHRIYTVGAADVHTDHGIVFQALLTSVKSFARPAALAKILAYEVLSSTDVFPAARAHAFTPNAFCDVSETLEEKLEIMSLLPDELHEPPGPRSLDSIRALGRYRGSTIGVRYAEAFEQVFEVF